MKPLSAKMTRRAVVVALAATTLAACGSNTGGSGSGGTAAGSASDVETALSKGGQITVWAWEPTLKPVVADFEKKYPKVKVKLVNAGTGNDQYTALQNAIKAGSGVPDVAQIEYYALPQFILGKSVTDLASFGASDLKSKFSTGPWSSSTSGNGVYALPMDSGPMALFYNKQVFAKYGIAVPKTWDEYLDAARKLHKADPKAYITNDTGDAGFTTSMIWQAGGKPFSVNGTNVKINLTSDPGVQKFAKVWSTMVSEGLVAPVSSWSDGWYKGLGDGSIATLSIGAWMPANLESGVAAGKGKWAVAPLPQWTAGQKASSENGGSSLAVPEASQNKALAYAFLKYADVEDGVKTRVDGGAFPATTAELNSPAFLGKTFPYFGGQKVNEVLSQSAKDVVPGWSYLPFQVYANSIFNDTVGQAYSGKGDLASGLKAWQDAAATYGNQQGFSVNK
ncbi:sugar ABC transporter substrate-binding protein [Terrabacter terrae]|uniref:Sugar ABC transporter substrate-binding protein n=1 Tax=Terrabacter terrae TaxID=318434 RepID=A0ABN2U9G8_9MICO